jgi:Zn/Cd-binding protein ZinT|tara:strand:- start:1420 stop:1821 length:402 start_codon:yes stop_codon:yes gene_type:complete
MAEDNEVSVDKLTGAFIKIRNARAVLSTEFKEKDSILVMQQDKIRQGLLDYCSNQNVESARTSEGSFFRTTKTKFWTSDWESMYEFIMENKVPEFFDKRLNQTNIKQFLEENPDLMPKGLNTDTEYSIVVRKK